MNGGTADNAAFAPAARNQSRMAGHTASPGQNSLGGPHSLHILRVGLFPYQKYVLAFLGPCNRVVCRKNNLSDGAAWTGRKSFRQNLSALLRRRVNNRVQKLVNLLWSQPHHRFFLIDKAFV